MKTITGSRSLDLKLFSGLLILLLISTPRLRVYYRGTPSTVTVTAVGANGVRIAVEVPEPFQGVQPGIHSTERRIQSFADTPAAKALTPLDGHLEWSILFRTTAGEEKARTLITKPVDENQ